MSFLILIAIFVCVNAVISVFLALAMRSSPLAILASVAITQMLYATFASLEVAASSSPYIDMLLLARNVTLMITTPVVLGTSTLTVLAVKRWRQNQSASGVSQSAADMRAEPDSGGNP